MKNPFQYGKIAEKEHFIDRDKDRSFLKSALFSGTNVILVSPRRWGKSSLVKQAMAELEAQESNVRVCFIDAYTITSSAEFYSVFAREVLRATSSHVESVLQAIGKFLKSVAPKVSFSPEPMSDFSLSFSIADNGQDETEVLQLPERIAQDKGLQIIVCIDEFQSLSKLPDYSRLESRMRSVWQHQQSVSYCLYGSQRHMMAQIFDSSEKPFYRFGQIYHLPKIDHQDWMRYITDRFALTGKTISTHFADKIITTVECHSWYVQQLAAAVWNFTDEQVTDDAFQQALEWCMDVNSEAYMRLCDNLSEQQIELLRAVARGEQQLSSTQVLRRYRMGTSASVTKNKRVLINMDVLALGNRQLTFLDPIFKIWFTSHF